MAMGHSPQDFEPRVDRYLRRLKTCSALSSWEACRPGRYGEGRDIAGQCGDAPAGAAGGQEAERAAGPHTGAACQRDTDVRRSVRSLSRPASLPDARPQEGRPEKLSERRPRLHLRLQGRRYRELDARQRHYHKEGACLRAQRRCARASRLIVVGDDILCLPSLALGAAVRLTARPCLPRAAGRAGRSADKVVSPAVLHRQCRRRRGYAGRVGDCQRARAGHAAGLRRFPAHPGALLFLALLAVPT